MKFEKDNNLKRSLLQQSLRRKDQEIQVKEERISEIKQEIISLRIRKQGLRRRIEQAINKKLENPQKKLRRSNSIVSNMSMSSSRTPRETPQIQYDKAERYEELYETELEEVKNTLEMLRSGRTEVKQELSHVEEKMNEHFHRLLSEGNRLVTNQNWRSCLYNSLHLETGERRHYE